MKEGIETFVSHMKSEIQKKYGEDIHYAKDCQVLSGLIEQQINRRISASTLKRFFGIIQSKFNPSKYTLDTLAIYLNFENWEDFINSFENSKHVFSKRDSWEQVKRRTRVVTNYSLKSLKAKIGDQLSALPLRSFAVKKFERFLESQSIATALIAPGGYGKSTIVTQLTEKYFTGKDPIYPNDIICLIDGGILVNLISLNIEINRLHNLLEFDPRKSYSNFFRENPDQVKGRFVLIIDGLNEIYYQTVKLTHFVENLMNIISSYETIPWFKLIITCRPDNWKIFSGILKKRPHLKPHWFDVSFESSFSETINVPLLQENEIKFFLEKKQYKKSLENLMFHYPEITGILNNPYLLHLFSISQNPENIHSDIDLLSQFIFKKVLSEPFMDEKSRIINSFFTISEYARQNTSVNKEKLLASENFEQAYNELLAGNILYEYTVPGSYLSVNTYVKFSHDILLEFFLANKWIKENSFDLKLLKRIIRYYSNNLQLKCNILKYLVKFAFKENLLDLLKEIYTIFEEETDTALMEERNQVDQDIINVIGVELRKNKRARDFLIPNYAQSQIGQFFYFESFFDMDCLVLHSGDNIKFYLENKHTTEAKIYGHFLKFLQYFLAADKENCEKEYKFFQNFELPGKLSPKYSGYYYGVQIIYQSVFEGKIDENLLESIFRETDRLYESKEQMDTMPHFEFLIVFTLNFGDQFDTILKIINLVISRYDLSELTSSSLYQIFKSIHARALLNKGKPDLANRLFEEVELKSVPINNRYYVNLRFLIIQTEFLIFAGKRDNAVKVIDEIKAISKMLRFKYFYDKAKELENSVWRGNMQKIT